MGFFNGNSKTFILLEFIKEKKNEFLKKKFNILKKKKLKITRLLESTCLNNNVCCSQEQAEVKKTFL